MCCCLLESGPVSAEERGRKANGKPSMSSNNAYGEYYDDIANNQIPFQTPMYNAPCHSCGACCWFMGQFIPFTCGCTQVEWHAHELLPYLSLIISPTQVDGLKINVMKSFHMNSIHFISNSFLTIFIWIHVINSRFSHVFFFVLFGGFVLKFH